MIREYRPFLRRTVPIAAALACISAASLAQPPKASPSAVEGFQGLWNLRGERMASVLDCGVFQGKHHVVCNGKRMAANELSSRMMVLSDAPQEGVYTFYEIDSSGSILFVRGTLAEGVFTFLDGGGNGEAATRVLLTFSADAFTVREERSAGGGPWTLEDERTYDRMK